MRNHRWGLVVVWTLAVVAACDDTPGEVCVGGVILDDGTCVARCDPALCLPMNVCVDNQCRLQCTGHDDCIAGQQECAARNEDGSGSAVTVCVDHDAPGVGIPCPNGTECAASLLCVGGGIGDGNAYCTRTDCLSDAECPSGYECGVIRDPREICGTGKGGGERCGTTTDPCVDPSQLSAEGPLIEGPDCILRRTCLARSTCSACASSVDCSLEPGAACVEVGGTSVCALGCAGDGDCHTWETCSGGSCAPRFGMCTGTGGFCEPCRDDRDCAALGAMGMCTELYRGETACIDGAYSTPCTTSDDCPVAPSGRHGACLDETLGLSPGDPLYHRCWAPFDPAANAASCW